MVFDYRSSTKEAYKDPKIARRYHNDFTGALSWRRLRFRFIAHQEKRAIGALLALTNAKTVVDIPCGTGKLAELFARAGRQVIAADVSAEMLEIARTSYLQAGAEETQFAICDAESLSTTLADRDVDLVVCLRLMHRVPREVRARMLGEIAKTAGMAIVSFGVDSRYQALRRRIRNLIFGGGTGEELCGAPYAGILEELAVHFEVLREMWVSPFISEEIVFLLESKVRKGRA